MGSRGGQYWFLECLANKALVVSRLAQVVVRLDTSAQGRRGHRLDDFETVTFSKWEGRRGQIERGKKERHDDRLVVEGFDGVDEVKSKGQEGGAVVVVVWRWR